MGNDWQRQQRMPTRDGASSCGASVTWCAGAPRSSTPRWMPTGTSARHGSGRRVCFPPWLMTARLAPGSVQRPNRWWLFSSQPPSRRRSLQVAAVNLPLPFIKEQRTPAHPVARPAERPQPLKVLAFVQFFINGRPVSEAQDVRANLVYDLGVEVRLSAPVPADIELTPYVVEPEGVVEAPKFVLRADDETRTAVGRLLVRIAHESLARPLEVAYGFEALDAPEDGSVQLRLQGQHRLVLRCVDDIRSWSGNEAIEEAVAAGRAKARSNGLRDSETSAFLQLFGSTAHLGADALATNAFRGDWPEERFQAEVRRRLRQDPGIGSDLEDHPHAGGGITDLSFRRVRLELKCDERPLNVMEAFEAYGEQLVQYAVGSDRRSGVLAVLCPTTPGSPPGALQNDLASFVVPPPAGGDRAVLVGVVLVRSNLPTPSSHSR